MYKICKIHGRTKYTKYHLKDSFRCLKCRSAAVSKRRRKVKEVLVQEYGNQCQICKYNKYIGALQFHHIDPSKKKFALSCRGLTKSIKKIRKEAKKCVLLCANCHAEVEAGITKLPL